MNEVLRYINNMRDTGPESRYGKVHNNIYVEFTGLEVVVEKNSPGGRFQTEGKYFSVRTDK